MVHGGLMPSQTLGSPQGAQPPPSCARDAGHGLALLVLTAAFVQLSPKLCPHGITTLTQKRSLTPSSSRWGRGMGSVFPPRTVPTGQGTGLWEQSKRRAQAGGLTSPSVPGAEGRTLPGARPTCCCPAHEAASPRRAQSRPLHRASRRSFSRRQGTAPATAKPLLQQQRTSMPAPTGRSKGCGVSGLSAMVVGAVGLQSHSQQHVLVRGTQSFPSQRNKSGLSFDAHPPPPPCISQHSPCQGMCSGAQGCRRAATCAAEAVGGPQWNGAMANPTTARSSTC